ncbi:MAG: BBE domain-containing protein [Hyphomicrobiaceae bacterium]
MDVKTTHDADNVFHHNQNIRPGTGMAKLAQEIDRQAAMLGYMNAFILYTAMSVIAIPLVLLLGGRRRGGA